jgi:hypothetical protein
MGLYTIILIYEVPAKTQYQATDELAEAWKLHAEKVYHVKTIARESRRKSGRGTVSDRRPPAKWGNHFQTANNWQMVSAWCPP